MLDWGDTVAEEAEDREALHSIFLRFLLLGDLQLNHQRQNWRLRNQFGQRLSPE